MNVAAHSTPLVVELAKTSDDVIAAQKLRYDVFAAECGANVAGIDHDQRIERDAFDAHADHLLLKDPLRPKHEQTIGVYRLMQSSHAEAAGGFYSADEFDLTSITTSLWAPLEMSRSCLHRDYRGGTALQQLWKGLGEYVAENSIDVVFGVASFMGASMSDHRQSLALLHRDHLAPANLRPTVRGNGSIAASTYADTAFDRRSAMIAMPALIKAYLRMGGVVGEGAYVDTDFGTTDVCMILETSKLNARQNAFLGMAQNG